MFFFSFCFNNEKQSKQKNSRHQYEYLLCDFVEVSLLMIVKKTSNDKNKTF